MRPETNCLVLETKMVLSGFLFQGYHLSSLTGERWGFFLVDGADEKKEMGTALCGLCLLFLIFLKSWRDVNVTYIWSGPILFDLSAF